MIIKLTRKCHQYITFSHKDVILLLSLMFIVASASDQDHVSDAISTQDLSSISYQMSTVTISNNKTDDSTSQLAPNCTINVEEICPDGVSCHLLGGECIDCDFNLSCAYGTNQTTKCRPKPNVNCSGEQVFEKIYECRYCYQLSPQKTWCNRSTECALNKPRNYYPARPFYTSTCWAKHDNLCMGRRCFYKQIPCNWSQGYKWSTALLLSIFLGGFGVDRFYLGLWREGIGKLLSFGGLGVWTLVDVILIAVGYVGPWDGSLYI
ncbi:TM2 domain-containing protein 3 isoform X1 [Biomphalaria glabrata]|nr:TM2 domain-containing protein 3 isoform X1 [Biomphalaria glabrata]